MDVELKKAEELAEKLRAEKVRSDKMLALIKLKKDNALTEATICQQETESNKQAKAATNPQKSCSSTSRKPHSGKPVSSTAALKQHRLFNIKDLRASRRLQSQVSSTLDLLRLHEEDLDSTASEFSADLEHQCQR